MKSESSKNDPRQEETEEARRASGEPEAAPSAEGSPDPVQSLQEKLQDSEKKYLYLYSEFESFRRRTERDRIDFLKFGHEGFLRDLLQVVDNFDRALSHAKSMESEKGSPLGQVVQGIEMIHFQMLESLRQQGAQPVASIGAKFDPNFHEAVADEEADAEPGTILKEMQKGYTLHGRLLRPARVVVARRKI